MDPLIGLESLFPLARNFAFLLRADIGGFNIGEDWSWSILGAVNWRFANRWALTLGWSILDFERVIGSGADRTAWNLDMQGPVLGLTYFF